MPFKDRADHREFQARWKRDRNQEFRELLCKAKQRPCADCGVEYPPYVMDFDHVRGEKLAAVSRVATTKNRATIEAEIAKCDVVCSNCHRIRTWNRQQHGNLRRAQELNPAPSGAPRFRDE